MKIRINLKSPDCLYHPCLEAARASAPEWLDEGDKQDLIREKQLYFEKICGKWFRSGEYLTVEVDTEKETIEILPAN